MELEINREEEESAAITCAAGTAIVAIVAGQDGKIAIKEIIKLLQQINP